MNINICLCCDNNYVKYAATTIASVLKNAEKDSYLKIFIIGNNIDNENTLNLQSLTKIHPSEIQIIKPAADLFDEFKTINKPGYISMASFFRLKLASLLPNIDKIIYLDCDLIVQSDLKELYQTNLDNYPLGGVHDINHNKYTSLNDSYINAGVLLINLKQWRDEQAEKLMIQTAQQQQDEIIFADQDIINITFKNRIYHLEDKWNIQVINFYSFSHYKKPFNIIHFIGASKPWIWGSFMPYKKKYFEYMKYTNLNSPSALWQIKSNIYSYLRYFTRKPLFMFSKQFKLALKNNILKDI